MPRYGGVQYASTAERQVPMHDATGAAAVMQHIAGFYSTAFGACGCGAYGRMIEQAQMSQQPDPLVHAAGCAATQVIPFDAAALVETHCGRYTRGAHKGQLRGWAILTVVTEGGWKKDGPGEGNGHVLRPGRIVAIRIVDRYSGKLYLEVR